jgi:hypothetical protein
MLLVKTFYLGGAKEMGQESISEQVKQLCARWELASRIEGLMLGAIGAWPEGLDYINLPVLLSRELEEFQIQAGGSFYVQNGVLTFVSLADMAKYRNENHRDALSRLIDQYRGEGRSTTRIEALLGKLP